MIFSSAYEKLKPPLYFTSIPNNFEKGNKKDAITLEHP